MLLPVDVVKFFFEWVSITVVKISLVCVLCVLHYATCIGLGYLAIFSNPAVQLFSCKYVTIKLSWVELFSLPFLLPLFLSKLIVKFASYSALSFADISRFSGNVVVKLPENMQILGGKAWAHVLGREPPYSGCAYTAPEPHKRHDIFLINCQKEMV